MTIHLVVTRHFGPHKPGDRITDEATVASIRESPNHGNVVPVTAPEEPRCAPAEAPPPSQT